MKSTSKKTVEADWGEFLGCDTYTEVPEGYMSIQAIVDQLRAAGKHKTYQVIQKILLGKWKAGEVDRISVMSPESKRRMYYYKQN